MIAQHSLVRLYAAEKRNRPRPRTRSTMRITDIRRQFTALLHFPSRAFRTLPRRRSLLRTRRLRLVIAPLCAHELAVVAIGHVMACQIVPKEAGAGVVDIRLIVLQRVFVGILTLKIVRSLVAPVGDLPRLFVVIGRNRSRGP